MDFIQTMGNDKRSKEAKQWRKLYGTARWQKLRAWHLSHNPLCVFCADLDGIATSATIVDHILPHKGNLTKFWDNKNLQSLCAPCHDGRKQWIEKNDHRPTIGADGWPIENS